MSKRCCWRICKSNIVMLADYKANLHQWFASWLASILWTLAKMWLYKCYFSRFHSNLQYFNHLQNIAYPSARDRKIERWLKFCQGRSLLNCYWSMEQIGVGLRRGQSAVACNFQVKDWHLLVFLVPVMVINDRNYTFFPLGDFKVWLSFWEKLLDKKNCENVEISLTELTVPMKISDLVWVEKLMSMRKAPTLPGLRLSWWKMYSMHSLPTNHLKWRTRFWSGLLKWFKRTFCIQC